MSEGSTSASSAQPEQVASVTTIRRINRELTEIQSHPSPHWAISIIGDNILEYHFTIRGPPATDFEGGLYHGRLLLPFNYPFAPPSIMLLNPNGRFELSKKICLSMSNFHPELWQPAWGIRTIMEALRSFFPTPGEGAIGALDWPPDLRKKLAEESLGWTCEICKKRNDEILVFMEEDFTPLRNPAVPVKMIEEPPILDVPATSLNIANPPVPENPVVKSESNREIILNISIFSIIFIIIALVVEIFRNPIE